MQQFEEWRLARRKFLWTITLFCIVFYMFLPIGIALFPRFMTMNIIGGLTLVWILAFLQLIVTISIGILYWYYFKHIDNLLIDINEEDKE